MKQTLTKLLGSALTLLFLMPNMASATITATWDWAGGKISSGKIEGTIDYLSSDLSGVSLYVDATNGKLQSNANNAQFNIGTKLRVPVVSTSDVLTVVSNNWKFKNIKIGGTTYTDLSVDYYVTASDVNNGYVEIESISASEDGQQPYLNSISATLAYLPPTPRQATWDFTGHSTVAAAVVALSQTSSDQTITVNGLDMVVNANGKQIGDNGNSIWSYPGLTFHVPVISTEDVVTVNGFSGYCEYTIDGGATITDATTNYNPNATDVERGYVEVVNGVNSYKYICSISVKQKSQTTLSISTYKWATFNNANYAIDFSNAKDAINAYMVTGREGTAITKTAVTGTIPKNTGLLINGDAGTYAIAIVSSSNTDVSSNLMKPGTGADVSAESGKTKYVLGVNGEEAQFLRINATKATVSADKAYLEFNEEINASALIFDGSFDNTTSIESIQDTTAENEVFFNLAGQRVAQPTKGLYIVNGKKVIIK